MIHNDVTIIVEVHMLQPIIETLVRCPYYFRHTFSNRGVNLTKEGNPAFGFSDADIEWVVNGNPEGNPINIRWYKEKIYEYQTRLRFTIFEVETNDMIVELIVDLPTKRMWWEKPIPRWTFPDLLVGLKIHQDPNIIQIKSTSIY